MAFDAHKNFSYSTIATAPSPATSGTSLTVQAGDGALFPQPSTDGAFNVTIWPAGSAPISSNSEIVRCTARSGDTLTITRTQEGTSARTVITGDQVALTITAKLFTDVEAKTDPSVIIVAAPTGVAATDNAAIAAAITACPTGGVVQLQAGTYAIIDGTTTTTITIAKKLTLRGRGGADALWANFGTLVTVDHATAVGFTISVHGVHIENMAVQNTHVTAPTAGAGIQTVSGGGNSTHYGPDLSVRGFYYCVDHQAGAEWFMDPSCFMYDFVFCGLRIQNVDIVDAGDMAVSGQFIAGPTNNATAAIEWMSGGGFKGYAIKVNTRGSATLTIGILLELQDGVTTSDFLLTDSSLENCSWAILLEHAGPSNTGIFANIVVMGCQTLCVGGATTYCIAIAPAVTSKVSAVNISGNVIRGGASQGGVRFVKIDNASHGPNVFAGVGTAYSDGGSNTNITSVGAG
jgi:hypothetical protein